MKTEQTVQAEAKYKAYNTVTGAYYVKEKAQFAGDSEEATLLDVVQLAVVRNTFQNVSHTVSKPLVQCLPVNIPTPKDNLATALLKLERAEQHCTRGPDYNQVAASYIADAVSCIKTAMAKI